MVHAKHVVGAVTALGLLLAGVARAAKPNVVIVMTDDQGYGDLSVHGNPVLRTPNLDRLHAQSVRFTDFHVSPFCTPTRAALMTGRYAARTGAYRTSHGSTAIHPREVTMAEVFAANGYRTGLFGKWHLGDNYPSRPMDKGFQHAVWHRCGGVTQISDYYGNDYFDDTYLVNDSWRSFEGYCTNVWFREATRFIEAEPGEPFFAYIATNAPHGPFLVAPRYSEPYERAGDEPQDAAFKGMIANFDENLGKFLARLETLGIADNTILVFLTDNGTARGARFEGGVDGHPVSGFNAGMRGRKSSAFDGGHRVPLFIRWPAGGLGRPRDVDGLAAHIDLLPTLMELCGLERRSGPPLDGQSLADTLRGNGRRPDRVLFAQIHGGTGYARPGDRWEGSAVMTSRWRLVAGNLLYDMRRDPSQIRDVASEHPETVTRLRAAHERWYRSVAPGMRPTRIVIGHEAENPADLTSQEWQSPGSHVVWSRSHLEQRKLESWPWLVNVSRAGRYRFTLSRWPRYEDRPIASTRARLQIGDIVRESAISEPDAATEVSFEVELSAGPAELQTWLTEPGGQTHGAYFVSVERLE
ncbi:MAG: arylsulfatase [Acidobacteriia bacterium]|nr:arylsulfatase [Terriglobia bacterium]MYG01784.1 arylsulfatase [Terriglobia bacterium]MYK08823.1 arylsulfatase [Terriglobia bacterium]